MKTSLILPVLTLAASTVVVAGHGFEHMKGKMSASNLFARQICGTGSTCAEACGTGYEMCDHFPYCYNPTAGDTCCGASGHYCPSGQFCAPVEGYCCENGQDPATCALEQGFTLPPETSTPGTTVAVSSVTPMPANVTTPTITGVVGPATYTGAAVKLDAGWAGQALGLVFGLGGLI